MNTKVKESAPPETLAVIARIARKWPNHKLETFPENVTGVSQVKETGVTRVCVCVLHCFML